MMLCHLKQCFYLSEHNIFLNETKIVQYFSIINFPFAIVPNEFSFIKEFFPNNNKTKRYTWDISQSVGLFRSASAYALTLHVKNFNLHC